MWIVPNLLLYCDFLHLFPPRLFGGPGLQEIFRTHASTDSLVVRRLPRGSLFEAWQLALQSSRWRINLQKMISEPSQYVIPPSWEISLSFMEHPRHAFTDRLFTLVARRLLKLQNVNHFAFFLKLMFACFTAAGHLLSPEGLFLFFIRSPATISSTSQLRTTSSKPRSIPPHRHIIPDSYQVDSSARHFLQTIKLTKI